MVGCLRSSHAAGVFIQANTASSSASRDGGTLDGQSSEGNKEEMITMKTKESMWKSYRLSKKLAINNYVNFSENLDTLIVELEWLSAYRRLGRARGRAHQFDCRLAYANEVSEMIGLQQLASDRITVLAQPRIGRGGAQFMQVQQKR